MWHEFTAQQGNEPGAQQGEVVVTLMQPVGGVGEVTLPSNDVAIAAEAGNMIGVQLLLGDGRRLFVGAGNVAGILDAPVSKEVRGRRSDGDPATGGRRPEQGTDTLPQDRPEHEGRGADEHQADDDAAAAAHDKAEAAHDKSEAAEDKAAATKRRTGR